MTNVAGHYSLEWDPEAEAEVAELRPFDARPILKAIRDLRYEAEHETRNRRPLRHPIRSVPKAWLAKLGRELRQMVRAYDGSAREAKKLLECILIAEEEGLPDVAEIRRELASKLAKVSRKRAA